jgi:hypothetical protein
VWGVLVGEVRVDEGDYGDGIWYMADGLQIPI